MHEKRVFSGGVKNVKFDQFHDGFHSGDKSRWKAKTFLHKKSWVSYGCRGDVAYFIFSLSKNHTIDIEYEFRWSSCNKPYAVTPKIW